MKEHLFAALYCELLPFAMRVWRVGSKAYMTRLAPVLRTEQVGFSVLAPFTAARRQLSVPVGHRHAQVTLTAASVFSPLNGYYNYRQNT